MKRLRSSRSKLPQGQLSDKGNIETIIQPPFIVLVHVFVYDIIPPSPPPPPPPPPYPHKQLFTRNYFKQILLNKSIATRYLEVDTCKIIMSINKIVHFKEKIEFKIELCSTKFALNKVAVLHFSSFLRTTAGRHSLTLKDLKQISFL
uniref:Uncharacterized protein n=1 Tax=Glossina brevipalpis TaxID=37001 RepID=A0A1A9WMA9_9MUSC